MTKIINEQFYFIPEAARTHTISETSTQIPENKKA